MRKAVRGKSRLDRLMLERGLEESRQKAQALVMAGRVLVDGRKVDKPGTLIPADSVIEIAGPPLRYVGRGGLKLEAALEAFRCDVRGKVYLDIGSSTGGFVDCLLQHGAARVISIDVGPSQMDSRLRQDSRVRIIDHTNARYLTWEQVGEQVDGITVDVAFISATMVLQPLVQFCRPGTRLIVLVKPQFEVGKGQVGRRGIVRDEELHRASVDKVLHFAIALGFSDFQMIPSPILGAEGNREFFISGVFSPGRNSSTTV
jgi:23S rRNA (cytidine1920-2'-O)/16S rRNA (cytidine1409-2'-O)-methyltransferase